MSIVEPDCKPRLLQVPPRSTVGDDFPGMKQSSSGVGGCMADQSAPTLHLPGPPSQATLWADKIPEHSITTTTKERRLFSLLELKATTLFVFTRAPFPILDGVESVLFIPGAAISRNRAHVSSGKRISPALRCG